jgi:hypothetical protein
MPVVINIRINRPPFPGFYYRSVPSSLGKGEGHGPVGQSVKPLVPGKILHDSLGPQRPPFFQIHDNPAAPAPDKGPILLVPDIIIPQGKEFVRSSWPTSQGQGIPPFRPPVPLDGNAGKYPDLSGYGHGFPANSQIFGVIAGNFLKKIQGRRQGQAIRRIHRTKTKPKLFLYDIHIFDRIIISAGRSKAIPCFRAASSREQTGG